MKESEQLNHYYYIKHCLWKERQIDRKLEKGWAGSATCDIEQVLGEVPTYEEYKAMQDENTKLKERNDSLNNRDINLCRIANGIREENFALKELLKRCKRHINASFPEIYRELLQEINQVLGEE